ncbi:hypothetical protein K501DRAFT_171905 [Backusella circina FSU 941]|nr:hypothetical protein K501DRAFT_171905 [Backusella circina FSU 941]
MAASTEQQGYNLFTPDFTNTACTLISSSLDLYNNSIKHCLEQEQIRVDSKAQYKSNNYFRNAKWSPDGSCLLTNSADDILRAFQL